MDTNKLYTKEWKNLSKRYNDISVKYKRILIEEGRKNGIFYDPSLGLQESDYCETEEKARRNLIDKLSSLKYVKILNNKNGVKWVEIDSGWKIYRYSIHAHHSYEVIGKETSKTLFGKTYEREILKPIIYASLELNGSCFKEDKEYDLRRFDEYTKIEKEIDEYLK